MGRRIGRAATSQPIRCQMFESASVVGVSLGNEPLQLLHGESDASPDANRNELLVPDELIDRRAAEAQTFSRLLDGHEKWSRWRRDDGFLGRSDRE